MQSRIEKKEIICYIRYSGGVRSMLGAVGYVDNILSKNNYLDVQVENKVNSGLAEKIWLLSFVKQVRKVYKKANVFSKYFEKNKEILHGKTTIKGTRITPDTITDYFIMKCDQEQDSEKVIQQILMDYPSINEEDIVASLIYVIATTPYWKFLLSK